VRLLRYPCTRAGVWLLTLACGGPSDKNPRSPVERARDSPSATAPAEPPSPSTAVRVGAAASAAFFPEPDNVGPRSFRIVGPFPNGSGSDPNGHRSLDVDYLSALGGEAAARIDDRTRVEWDQKTFAPREATLGTSSTLDLAKLFGGDTDHKTAYAYTEWNVDKPGRALAVFGSDDGAVVWLNGWSVHRFAADRALDPNADRFELPLVPGTNRILIKVDNGTGGWGFALRVVDDEGRKRLLALDARRHLDWAGPGPLSGEYLIEDSFPEIDWTHWAAAERALETRSMRVRWYGPDFKETERPEKDGAYTAVVEAKTLDGYTYRHMLTFARGSSRLTPRFRSPPMAELPVIDVPWHFDAALNEAQRAELSRYFWRGAAKALGHDEDSAIAALGFTTLGERPPPKDEPLWLQSGFIDAAAHQLQLRMQLEGRTPRPLVAPERLSSPAPELRNGTEMQAAVRPGTVEKLRAVAQAWAKDDPHPFVALVARRGVVFMHEGYNGFRKDSAFWPASITKSITGLLFARAVEQGLVTFDQEVGTVLSDWKQEPTTKVTFRHCFYHVSGLREHASHGGMFNAYLDNALFVEDAAFARPLSRYLYNGDDINLAGKALELVTGQPIWRLLYENVEKPFAEPVAQFDPACCGSFTSMYLAKVGQMIVQDGRYGRHRFFTPGFLDSLRPRRISEFAPGIDDPQKEAGIGLAWMPDPPGPRERGVLGPNVIGHGAASGTTWRIDRDHELVVVIGRDAYKQAAANDEWAAKFVRVLADALVN
jgi:CubicO group peptidase (beta-lactamase class C family)